MLKVLSILSMIIISAGLMVTIIDDGVNAQERGPIRTNIDLDISIDGLVVKTQISATYLNEQYNTVIHPVGIRIPQGSFITSFEIDGVEAILVEKNTIPESQREGNSSSDDDDGNLEIQTFDVDLEPNGYHTVRITFETRLLMANGNYSFDFPMETFVEYPDFHEVSVSMSDQWTHMLLDRYIDVNKGGFPLIQSKSLNNGFHFSEGRNEPYPGDNIGFSIGTGEEGTYSSFYDEKDGEGYFMVSCSPDRKGESDVTYSVSNDPEEGFINLVEERLNSVGPGEEAVISGRYDPSEISFQMKVDINGPKEITVENIGVSDGITHAQSWVKRYWELAWMENILVEAFQMGGGNGSRIDVVNFSIDRDILSPYTEFMFPAISVEDIYPPQAGNVDNSDEYNSKDSLGGGISEKRISLDSRTGAVGYWSDISPEDLVDDTNKMDPEPTFLEKYWMVFAGSTVVFILITISAVGYSRLKEDELLKQKNRKKIYDYITENPGIYFRGIQKDLGLEVGTLSHHMNILEKEQLIVSEQDGNNRRFWVAGVKRDLEVIRLSRIQENILKEIQAEPGITQVQIANKLGVSRKVVFYHVKFLTSSEIVMEEKVKRRAHYYPTT